MQGGCRRTLDNPGVPRPANPYHAAMGTVGTGLRWGWIVGSLFFSLVARGQDETQWDELDEDAPGEAEAKPGPTVPEQARAAYQQGVAAFDAGDVPRALASFLASRELVPAWNSTMSAGVCLELLGRFDEAFEFYQEVVSLYDREDAEAAITRVTKKVGMLRVVGATGALVIDGRHRPGPSNRQVPVTPGRRWVRVVADGHAPFETQVEIVAGETAVLKVKLEPLVRMGGLRVQAEAGRVLVDGAVVGNAPWEGSVAPGVRVVQVLTEDSGSSPAEAVVTENQTSMVQASMKPLGPRHLIDVDPPTAWLTLNGVTLGQGRWDGVLPEGTYDLTAEEEGFFEAERKLDVPRGKYDSVQLTLQLREDPDHPRWPKPPTAHGWLGVVGGWGLGGSLRSGPERACPDDCSSSPSATGFMVGARGSYEFSFPLSLELTVGAMSLWRSVERRIDGSFEHDQVTYPISYDLEDTVRIRGPFAAFGASYGVPFHADWRLAGRTTVGVLFASTTDTVSGMAGDQPLLIANAGKPVTSKLLVVMPELGVQWLRDPWNLSVGLSVLFAPLHGRKTLSHGSMGVSPERCTPIDPGSPACAPQSDAISNERSYGPFWMFLPQIGASRRF